MFVAFVMWYMYEANPNRKNMIAPILSVSATFASIICHEATAVLFHSQQGNMQSVVALCLPVLKYVFRSIQTRICRDAAKEGMGIALIAFEVQFFNAFYAATFLEKVTAPATIAVLLGADVLENVHFFYDTYVRFRREKHTNEFGARLRLMFRTEMIVMIELVEVITPIIYAVWVTAIYSSSNRQYVAGVQDFEECDYVQTMANLTLFTLGEICTLVAFVTMLIRVYHMPVLQQMEFSLNKYKWFIIKTMGLWSLIVVWGRIEHTGNDYTFSVFRRLIN